MRDKVPKISVLWLGVWVLVGKVLKYFGKDNQIVLHVFEQLWAFRLRERLEHFVQVKLWNSFIIITIVKVEGQLVKYLFVKEQKFNLALVSFKINWKFEVYDVLPLLSHHGTVPVL